MSLPASPHPASRRPPGWPWIGLALGLVGLLIAFPPLRFVSKRGAASSAAVAARDDFAPVAFVEDFWTTKLQPAARVAPLIGPVLADLRRDPAAATNAHARRIGLGNVSMFFGRGAGRVTAVERNQLLLEIDGAIIALRSGPVFGNVVRDGCGLLEVNEVPGLAEFNAVSAEINRLVEERVQPALKHDVAIGTMISFAGCAQVPETLPAGGPLLMFVPVFAEVLP